MTAPPRDALREVLSELDRTLASEPPERAREILHRTALLYRGNAADLSADAALVFDEAFLRLLPVNDATGRARLAEAVAPHANAPRRTVRLLAFDPEETVASPVLRASPLLDEVDLLALARERGPGHLMAMSLRPTVPETVTDLLIERGGPDVVLSAVRNRGARLSNRACAQVLRQAGGVPDLRRALQLRPDVPRAQLDRIGAAVRASAGSAPGVPRSVAKLGAVFRYFLARTAREAPRLSAIHGALLAVHGVVQANRLDEAQIADWLRKGEHELAIAGTAYLTKLPVSLVQRAHRSAEPDGFELILASAGFAYDTFELALMSNPAWSLDAAQVERLVTDYRELRPEEARLAIRLAVASLRKPARKVR
ncbi:MAG TPA: DUF2336 domain-containing protein [Salinarimonas sp.]|nr:DUF2336 domain-containing protein [Salinarimonas sp.]